jgi:hypothetical protein
MRRTLCVHVRAACVWCEESWNLPPRQLVGALRDPLAPSRCHNQTLETLTFEIAQRSIEGQILW